MNGPSLVGASSWKPSGSACRRPARQTKTFLNRSSVRTSRCSTPSLRQSASAHGFSERNESGPASTRNPPACSVAMVPPSRSRKSTTVSSRLIDRSRASSTARCAAASPVMPPPTTTSFIADPSPQNPVNSHELGQHRDELGMIVDGRGAMELEPDVGGDSARLDVEVVEHLDVVAHEPDRHHDRVALALTGQPPEHLVDVGL